MTLEKISILMLISLMMLPSIMITALPANLNQQANTEENNVEKIIWIADSAKRRVETLINIMLANKTALDMIESADLTESLQGNLTLFNEGVELLETATEFFENGDYENAIVCAMEAMKIFRDVFKNINRILCQASVKRGELIDAQGLLQAMNQALIKIEKIEELMTRSSIENKIIEQTLNEAKNLLNIPEAISILQQGDAAEAAHNLAKANRLIAQATQMLKDELRQKLVEMIGNFKDKIRRRLEEIRERLHEINMSEEEFLKRLGFTSIEELKGKMMEIAERVRNQIRAGDWNITGNLTSIGNWMHELSFELEMRSRINEGGKTADLRVSIMELIRRPRDVKLTLKIENRGNVTLIFPNSAFGVIVEKRIGGGWSLYYSPLSLQVLVTLKPGESKVLEIEFGVTGHGVYRIVVHAKSMKETEWFEKYIEFSI